MNFFIAHFSFFLFSLLFSFFLFPIILLISKKKNIYTEINSRSSHLKQTPVLGGIVFYFAIIFSFFMYGYLSSDNNSIFVILISLTILLLIGVNDDLVPLKPMIKLIYQIISVLIIIFLSDFRFHIYDYWLSVAFTLFFFIFIINSFNLIDGVDGLSGLVAIAFFGFSYVISFITKSSDLAFISSVLVGVLISYLKYNFSKRNKIFMGDTGSLILGFMIAFLFIYMYNLKIDNVKSNIMNVKIQTSSIVLLFYPICDTIRIVFYRIFVINVNPFTADKNHIHHRYISLGFKHWEISVYIFFLTSSIVVFNFFTVENFSFARIVLLLSLFILLLIVPFKLFNISKK